MIIGSEIQLQGYTQLLLTNAEIKINRAKELSKNIPMRG